MEQATYFFYLSMALPLPTPTPQAQAPRQPWRPAATGPVAAARDRQPAPPHRQAARPPCPGRPRPQPGALDAPLMYLELGEVPVMVASSPAAAGEIMRAHDAAFASRPAWNTTVRVANADGQGLGFAPYGDLWRQLRRISVSDRSFSARGTSSPSAASGRRRPAAASPPPSRRPRRERR
ncbi:unnamed protein product [Urochloa humidicola]